MMIEIESGCVLRQDGLWEYTTLTSPSGQPDDVVITHYVFAAEAGERPKVGDFINNGRLVKRDKPKVNSDWSRWKDKDLYGNP